MGSNKRKLIFDGSKKKEVMRCAQDNTYSFVHFYFHFNTHFNFHFNSQLNLHFILTPQIVTRWTFSAILTT